MPRITLLKKGAPNKEVFCESGLKIGDVLPELPRPCGGTGICGRCVVLAKGGLSPMSDTERSLLGRRADEGYRLSCMAVITGDCEINAAHLPVDVMLSAPLPANLDNQLAKGEYAVAFDIGTTTVAAYLLSSDGIVKASGLENPQRHAGADVISRIGYAAQSKENMKRLRSDITYALNGIISDYKIDVKKIKRAAVCGNTAMQHILCGIPADSLGEAPFTPRSFFGREYDPEEAGLELECKVYLCPCVSGFVGGDLTAGLASIDIQDRSLYIDAGTNGEIALRRGDRIYCGSVAAGPALEGVGMSCGMPAAEGAISEIYIEDGKFKFKVIGESNPAGICGSGLIDAVAALLRSGMLDRSGLLKEPEFYLTDGIHISREDIRKLQLAKAAIAAGVDMLLKAAAMNSGEIMSVIAAGGFGTRLNPDSASETGLLRKALCEKLTAAGNAAGAGVCAAAVSDSFRRKIEDIASICSYVAFEAKSEFMESYISHMNFVY